MIKEEKVVFSWYALVRISVSRHLIASTAEPTKKKHWERNLQQHFYQRAKMCLVKLTRFGKALFSVHQC